MARAMQQLAAENDDPMMAAEAKEYENRALAAIKQGQSELFRLEKPKPAACQLRFPGF
jgi:Tfp pilus assembly protein PilF